MNGSLLDTLGTLSREFDAVLSGVHESACAELLPAQRELEVLSRKVLAAQVELDAAVADAGLRGEHGYATTRAMLADVHRLAPREATARQDRQEQVAGFAREFTPRETGVLGAKLLNRLDPDGPEPADPDEAPLPNNTLFLGRSRRGRLKLSGEFDAVGEAAIRAAIDALAKPSPVVDGIPDERSLAARQGDGRQRCPAAGSRTTWYGVSLVGGVENRPFTA